MSDALWPYVVILLAGVLPNEAFRIAGVFLPRGVSEDSELFRWIRIMATTLLAGLVARLLFTPAAALAAYPLWLRVGALGIGAVAFFAFRRSVVAGILAGEAVFVALSFWIGPG